MTGVLFALSFWVCGRDADGWKRLVYINSKHVQTRTHTHAHTHTYTHARAHTHARTHAGKSSVAPLVEEMLQRVSSEVNRYERVVTYWPVFGPLLEGA